MSNYEDIRNKKQLTTGQNQVKFRILLLLTITRTLKRETRSTERVFTDPELSIEDRWRQYAYTTVLLDCKAKVNFNIQSEWKKIP